MIKNKELQNENKQFLIDVCEFSHVKCTFLICLSVKDFFSQTFEVFYSLLKSFI